MPSIMTPREELLLAIAMRLDPSMFENMGESLGHVLVRRIRALARAKEVLRLHEAGERLDVYLMPEIDQKWPAVKKAKVVDRAWKRAQTLTRIIRMFEEAA